MVFGASGWCCRFVMKRLVATFAVASAFALFSTSDARAGGPNRLASASQYGDGFARVVQVGNKDVVQVLDMPKLTATMQCSADGYRVNKVGPQSFSPTKTWRTHTWKGSTAEAPSAKAIGDVCRAGRASAYLPVTIRGECDRIKGIKLAGGIDHKTLSVPFAVDCRGYGTVNRDALIMWWHPGKKDHVVLPVSANKYAPSLGYKRVDVIGEVSNKHSSNRWKLLVGSKNGKRMTMSNPATMFKVHKRGWHVGSRVMGYVEKTGGPGRVALHSFFSAARQEYTVSSDAEVVTRLVNAGYEHVAVEGYIYPPMQ